MSMVYKSEPAQISFNMPYQCGTGSGQVADSVTVRHVIVEDFDIVVAYSDGFADNVEDQEIPVCLQRYMEGGLVKSLSSAADCLARRAHFLSKDPNYRSPFNKQWQQAYEQGQEMSQYPPAGYNFLGGKEDDVTVTVAQIFAVDEKLGANDPMRSLAKNDTYFKEQKTVYKEKITNNTIDVTAAVPNKAYSTAAHHAG